MTRASDARTGCSRAGGGGAGRAGRRRRRPGPSSAVLRSRPGARTSVPRGPGALRGRRRTCPGAGSVRTSSSNSNAGECASRAASDEGSGRASRAEPSAQRGQIGSCGDRIAAGAAPRGDGVEEQPAEARRAHREVCGASAGGDAASGRWRRRAWCMRQPTRSGPIGDSATVSPYRPPPNASSADCMQLINSRADVDAQLQRDPLTHRAPGVDEVDDQRVVERRVRRMVDGHHRVR